MKKARIENMIYDVVDYSRCAQNNEYGSRLATEFQGMVYPLRGVSDSRPGLYTTEEMNYIIPAKTEEEKQMYGCHNIIDFSNATSIKDIMDNTNTLKQMEKELLTSTDNIYTPKIGENDDPIMRGFKEAILEKKIELQKYEPRFNGNYCNDRRLLDKDRITLKKLVPLMDIFDIKATIVFEDKNQDVPNPIGKKITISLGE